MAGLIEKGDVFSQRRQEVQHLIRMAVEHAPVLVPCLKALLQAEWIEHRDLRRLRWRLRRSLLFAAGRLVR